MRWQYVTCHLANTQTHTHGTRSRAIWIDRWIDRSLDFLFVAKAPARSELELQIRVEQKPTTERQNGQ